jgi:hypothetical protein
MSSYIEAFAILFFVVFATGYIRWAYIRDSEDAAKRQADLYNQTMTCYPYNAITHYDRGTKHLVLCAQNDGGVVEKEVEVPK